MEKWTVAPSDWWGASFKSIFWRNPLHKGASATPSRPGSPLSPDAIVMEHGDAMEVQQCPDLHPGLVGVKGVEETIRPYEADVGITHTIDTAADPLPLLEAITDDEAELALSQRMWEELVEGLLGGVCKPVLSAPLFELADSPSTSQLWDLNTLESPILTASIPRTSTPLSMLDLTESELSVDSEPMPSTPKASKKSYAHAVFSERPSPAPSGGRHPPVFSPLPSKPLNASALSFIPTSSTPVHFPHHPVTPPSASSSHSSDSSFPSPTYEFDFPSLNSNPTASPSARKTFRSLPATLQKDENGFYNPVGTSTTSVRTSTPRRSTAAFLPAFLAERPSPARARNTSKTREIVDRLRSSHGSSNRPRKTDLHSRRQSLPTHEDDDADQEAHGTVQTPPLDTQVSFDADGWITGLVHDEHAARDTGLTDDGWIDGSHCNTDARRRSASSVSLTPPSAASAAFPSPAPSLGSFGAPAFYAPPFAPANPAMMQAYMHMQLQMQHAQWQMPAPPASSAGFGAPLGFFPAYGPYGVAQSFAPAHQLGGAPGAAPVLYESKGKMGAAGMVHVQ